MKQCRETAYGGLLAAFLTLVPCGPTAAAGPVSCHCFTDRSFDPARPGAADDYILTTAFNSFMAGNFGIAKRQIVMMKMNGVNPGNLLVGLHVSSRSGVSLDDVLRHRKDGVPWTDVLRTLGVKPAIMGKAFSTAVTRGDDNAVEQRVADMLITNRLGTSDEVLAEAAAQGAGEKERFLDALLARHSGQAPGSFRAAVSRGEKSWGQTLQGLGLSPETVGPLAAEYGAGTRK